MEEDDFYLKWEKHHHAFVSVFDSLYKHNILVDCILAAEEKFIKAHRIVLMACSPYLQELLSQHADNYPIVFLDIKFSELQAIVDFCYRGEVKLPQNELSGFINAANILRIKGLCSTDLKRGKQKKRDLGSEASGTVKRHCCAEDRFAIKMEKEGVFENAEVPDVSLVEGDSGEVDSNQPGTDCVSVSDGVECVTSVDCVPDVQEETPNYTPAINNLLQMNDLDPDRDLLPPDQGSDNSDVDSDDSESSEDGERDVSELLQQGSASAYLFPWTCNRCGEAFTTRSLYSEHRKVCIDPSYHPWTCHKCPNSYKNKKDLVRHLIYCGNDVARLVCNRCGNTYKYERGLRRHQKYCGTDTKPLQCAQCNKMYKYKRGLRRHQRRCGLEAFKPSVVIKAEALKENDSPENFYGTFTEPWACSCGKAYKYRRSYLKHIDSCPGQLIHPPDHQPTDIKNITI